MSELSERIRVLREKMKWTQDDLAKESGIPQATISRIESGNILSLKSKNAIKLAKALKVTTDFLMGSEERMSFSDKVLTDPDAQYLFRGYEKLSDEGKHALKTYIKLLEMEDKKKKRK